MCNFNGRRRRRHRVASSGRRVAPPYGPVVWPVRLQCRCGVDLSSEREDDQDDGSSPHQVNEWQR